MRILSFVFLFVCFGGAAQSWKFRKEAAILMEPVDSVFAIETQEAGERPYDFIPDSAAFLRRLFLSELLEISRNRPDTLQESENLSRLARLATKYWRGSQYADKKKWGKLNKYFRRAINLTVFKFNLTQQISFRVPLVNKGNSGFYYDPKGSSGGLNLYGGNRPRTKEERENQEALLAYSQEEITAIFRKKIHRKIVSNLKKGNIAFVGLHIELDKNTMYRSKIPTVRVVIIFGAKRFGMIPEHYKTEERNK